MAAELLSLSDLNTTVNHEPRILDLTVAERLGYDRPRKVRDLIERNRPELESYGSVCPTAGQTSAKGGRPSVEFWLNEGQALVICALSRTPQAAAVRRAIIEVYMAWRRGQVQPPQPSAPREVRSHMNRIGHAMQQLLAANDRLREQVEAFYGQKVGMAATEPLGEAIDRQWDVIARAVKRPPRNAVAIEPPEMPEPETLARTRYADPATRTGSVNRYMEDRCVPLPDHLVPARRLYEDYVAWHARAGEPGEPVTRQGFGLAMTALGHERIKLPPSNRVHYLDLALR